MEILYGNLHSRQVADLIATAQPKSEQEFEEICDRFVELEEFKKHTPIRAGAMVKKENLPMKVLNLLGPSRSMMGSQGLQEPRDFLSSQN